MSDVNLSLIKLYNNNKTNKTGILMTPPASPILTSNLASGLPLIIHNTHRNHSSN
jgi:hypothetical protein